MRRASAFSRRVRPRLAATRGPPKVGGRAGRRGSHEPAVSVCGKGCTQKGMRPRNTPNLGVPRAVWEGLLRFGVPGGKFAPTSSGPMLRARTGTPLVSGRPFRPLSPNGIAIPWEPPARAGGRRTGRAKPLSAGAGTNPPPVPNGLGLRASGLRNPRAAPHPAHTRLLPMWATLKWFSPFPMKTLRARPIGLHPGVAPSVRSAAGRLRTAPPASEDGWNMYIFLGSVKLHVVHNGHFR